MIFCVAEKSFLIDFRFSVTLKAFRYRIEMAEEIKKVWNVFFELDYHLDFT